MAIAPPTIDSEYCYVINRYNGQDLYAKAENTASRFASFTKLMTMCWVVRPYYPTMADLQAISVTITADIAAEVGSSDVVLNDVWPGDELVKVALISSDNRACSALGHHVATNDMGYTGTVDEVLDDFVAEMNTAATAAGMTVATNYTTEHGAPQLGDANESSTAKEQALLFDKLCTWSVARAIWPDAPTTTCSIDRGGPWVENIASDIDVWTDTGVIGCKNGTGGGFHLFVLWEAPNGNEIIIVTLDASTQGASETDARDIIAQLPIDYPYLSGPTGAALPDPS